MSKCGYRYKVQAYWVDGDIWCESFDIEADALYYARCCFNERLCYKVKVWDLDKGPVIRNVEYSAGLILHLV